MTRSLKKSLSAADIAVFVNLESTDKCRLISNILSCCYRFSSHAEIVNTAFYELSVSSNSLDSGLGV